MDNLQHLAAKVLRKTTRKVSCLPTLGEETGNFSANHGNFDGNSTIKKPLETLMKSAFVMETSKETQGKLALNPRETFFKNNVGLQFPKDRGVGVLLDDFFKQADLLGLKLLPDDKHWLKAICISELLNLLEKRLNQYVECWLEGMAFQQQEHRKQNTGRFKANVFLRKAISINSRLLES